MLKVGRQCQDLGTNNLSESLIGNFLCFGDVYSSPITACEAPDRHITDNSDCDDSDQRFFPGAAYYEASTACVLDEDGDGWGDVNAEAPYDVSGHER